MDCCEFRETYSDFADGLLAEADGLRARRHLADCAACRRFDAAFRAGVDALRELPPVGVSRGFGEQLKGRLHREVAVRGPAADQWLGFVGALLVVATVGFVSWDLLEMRATSRIRQPAPAVAASAPQPAADVPGAGTTLRLDTMALARDPFHPLNPVLTVADAPFSPDVNHVRFDIPAVWGGR
jgi:anti-sigma factor RsiW